LLLHYTAIDTAFTKEVIQDLKADPAIQLLKEIPKSYKTAQVIVFCC
jgi:hypothetical protein